MDGGFNKHNSSEDDLINRIRNSDDKAFEELFFRYYKILCVFSMKYTRSPELAKDCVQEIFLKIWRRREEWQVHYSLKVYLYRAVRNQSLNQVEKLKNRRDYTEKYIEEDRYDFSDSEEWSAERRRLIKKIWEVVDKMPQRRKTVFELHRKHGLSYKEIAQVMNIVVKTVENHMGKALQEIRDNINSSDWAN